jgi:hypothetical protein
MSVINVAIGVVKNQNITNDKTPITVAKIVACTFEITPVTSGRLEVRAMRASDSLSITILKAFALPAASVPAKIVVMVRPNGGSPLFAKTIAGRVEIKSNSTTRSFIRSRYPRIVELTWKDYSANLNAALWFFIGFHFIFLSQ